MNELIKAIEIACERMSFVLDDCWSDMMDMEVMEISDKFNIEDTDWIEKMIKKNM